MAYFANSTEGETLDNQCGNCPLGESACPIYMVQSLYNYEQLNKGNEKLRTAMNMLVDSRGICKLRPLLGEVKDKSDVPAWLMEDKK